MNSGIIPNVRQYLGLSWCEAPLLDQRLRRLTQTPLQHRAQKIRFILNPWLEMSEVLVFSGRCCN